MIRWSFCVFFILLLLEYDFENLVVLQLLHVLSKDYFMIQILMIYLNSKHVFTDISVK